MKNYYRLSFLLVIALSAITISAQSRVPGGDLQEPFYQLLTPRAGDVLRAGTQVEITWKLTVDRSIVENEWAEMELVLETAEGVVMRMSPQMGIHQRRFLWTVPNITTTTAKIYLYCGIEGAGDMYRFEHPGLFTIRASRFQPSITLGELRPSVKPGEELEVAWTSTNIPPGSSYDVMVSYDRGAHYHKAGSTTETRYTLPIADDMAGAMVIQIVHRRSDGTKVESLVTRSATVRVADDSRSE